MRSNELGWTSGNDPLADEGNLDISMDSSTGIDEGGERLSRKKPRQASA